MKTILLILTLASIAYSGQIYSWADMNVLDPQLDTNTGPKLTLYFQLENDVPAGARLRVEFPFDAPTSGISATYLEVTSRCDENPKEAGSGSVTVSTINGETKAIFISIPKDLKAGAMNAVRVNLPKIANVTAGLSGVIGLYTTTSAEAGYMIIDSNPAFGDFEWVDASATTLALGDNANNLPATRSLGASYVQNFSFTPARTYHGGAIVKITASSRFKINSMTVVSVANNASAIPTNWAISTTTDGVATIIAPDGLPTQRILVSLSMVNPSAIVASGTIRVEIRRRYNGQLMEAESASGWIKSEWSTTAAATAIVNAFNQTPSTTTNHPIQFYTHPKGPYQTYKFSFKVTDVPTGFLGRITFALGGFTQDMTATPLKSSIVHNIDGFGGGKPQCSWSDTNYICNNVGINSTSTIYFFAIKLSRVLTATVWSDALGKITYQAVRNPDNSSASLEQLFQVTFTPAKLASLSMYFYFTGPTNHINTDAADKIYFRSATSDTAFLRIWIDGATSTVITSVFGLTGGPGLDIYTNRWVQATTALSAVLSPAPASGYGLNDTGSVSLPFVNSTLGDGVNTFHNRIKVGAATLNEFGTQPTNKKFYLKLTGVSILKPPSLKADEASFEIYYGVISGMTAADTADTALTYKSGCQGFYSFLYISGPGDSATPFASVGAAVVGNKLSHTNSGRYPALIRLYGSLSADEKVPTTGRLLVFFQNLIPYQANSAGDNQVLCTGSTGGKQTTNITCTYIQGEDTAGAAWDGTNHKWTEVVSSHRIEISFSAFNTAGTVFQVLIPVTLKSSSQPIDMYLATVDGIANSTIRECPLAFGESKAGPTVAAADAAVTIGGPTLTNRVKLISSYKVGTTVDEMLEIGKTDGLTITQNAYASGAAYVVNAGVQYCAIWNFFNGATIGTNAASANAEDICLTYSLNLATSAPSGTTVAYGSATRWCIFCPFSSATELTTGSPSMNIVPITKYQLWPSGHKWDTGASTSPAIGCLFDGATTVSAPVLCDDVYDAITANGLTASINPSSISSISSNNKLTISLTFTNPINRPTFAAQSHVIYMRSSIHVIQQEAGTSCVASTGSCVFSQSAGLIGDEFVTGTVQPYQFVLSGLGSGPVSALNITLYGVNPVSGFTTNQPAVVHFSSRVIYTATTTLNALIDTTSTTSAFTVNFAQPAAFVPELSAVYNVPIRGARNSLRINFKPTGSRDIYRGEKFTILWGSTSVTGPSTPNPTSNLACEVWDTNGKFVTAFKTCVVDGNQIELAVTGDVAVSTLNPYVLLRGYTTVDFGTASLGAKLTAGSGNTIVQNTSTTPTTPIAPTFKAAPTTQIAFGGQDVNVTRVQNQLGRTSTLQFVIRNNAGNLTAGSRILIDFPLYYSPKLSNLKNLTFIVNNASTNGRCINDRVLEVIIPTAVTNTSSITLRIIGISNVRYTTAGAFWIALDNNTDSTDGFAVAGTVSDVATAATDVVAPLWPYAITLTNSAGAAPQIRTSAILNFTILARTALEVNQTINIDFPESWSHLLMASAQQGVSCSGFVGTLNGTVPNSPSTPVATFLNVVGPTARLNVSAAIAQNTQLNISCTNFRAPDDPFPGNCLAESPVIAVFDANESAPIARSSPGSHHFERNVAIANPSSSLAILNAATTPNMVAQGTIQPLDQCLVFTPTSPFSRIVTATMRNSVAGISLAPQTGVANVGDESLRVAFQATPAANLGTYPILLNKAETSLVPGAPNTYSDFPFVMLQVTNQKADILPPKGPIQIPAGGKSVPLTYNLTQIPSVDVTFNVMVNDASITVSAPAGATPGLVKAGERSFDVILAVASTATVGKDYTLYVTASTSNNAFSVAPPNVTITVASPQTDTPTLAVTLDTGSTQNSPIAQAFIAVIGSDNATLATYAHTVFWTCALTSLNLNRDITYVQNALSNKQFVPGEVYGTIVYPSPNPSGNSIVVRNLTANTNFACKFWAVNQVGTVAVSNATAFKTASNGGKSARVLVNFNAVTFAPANIGSLLCWLAQTLAAPAPLIRAFSGEACGAAPLWNPVYTTYNVSNTISYTVVPIYFLANNLVPTDNLATTAQTSIVNPGWTTTIRSTIAPFDNFEGFTIVNSSTPTVQAPQVTNATSSTPVTVTFTAPSDSSAGFYVAGIWVYTNTTATPIFDDLSPFTSTPNDPLVLGVTFFNGTAFNPPNIQLPYNFTNGTTYGLYYAAACENPSPQINLCFSAINASPIIVNQAAVPVDSNQGSTSDARIISLSLGFLVTILICLFI